MRVFGIVQILVITIALLVFFGFEKIMKAIAGFYIVATFIIILIIINN